ncbi:MAG: hypothetical protein ABR985_19185 [Methanotrichaceae archaeon]|jgi:hypothetical protein
MCSKSYVGGLYEGSRDFELCGQCDNANIEITIQRTGDNDTFHKALVSIIGNYAWFADKSTYNGDLRIILDNSQSKMIDEWNTTASDAIAHIQDETIGTGWVESVINASRDVKAITLRRENVLSGAGVASARDYSVTAGNWNVSFNTSTPVFTNGVWSELQGMKNNGYFLIYKCLLPNFWNFLI